MMLRSAVYQFNGETLKNLQKPSASFKNPNPPFQIFINSPQSLTHFQHSLLRQDFNLCYLIFALNYQMS